LPPNRTAMSPLTTLYWSSVPASLDAKVFELRSNDKKLLSLMYNDHTHVAKFETSGNRRTYHIEKEGFLRNRTAIFNEYGVKIGQIVPDMFSHAEGSFQINEEQFHYSIYYGSVSRIKVYTARNKSILLSCSLSDKKGVTEINFASSISTEQFQSAINVLSWLLFIPNTVETKMNQKV